MKFGIFVPRNSREADESPEAPRWKAGRDLEWFRLQKEGTFDGEWTWDKVHAAYPDYKKSDVGFLFYVYDFKFPESTGSGWYLTGHVKGSLPISRRTRRR